MEMEMEMEIEMDDGIPPLTQFIFRGLVCEFCRFDEMFPFLIVYETYDARK